MIDPRIAVFLIWGLGVVIVYAIVLAKRLHRFQLRRHDRRQDVRRDVRRDVLSGGALFLVAFGAAGATLAILFGEQGTTPRSFMTALALGAFLGAGLVMASEEDTHEDAV